MVMTAYVSQKIATFSISVPLSGYVYSYNKINGFFLHQIRTAKWFLHNLLLLSNFITFYWVLLVEIFVKEILLSIALSQSIFSWKIFLFPFKRDMVNCSVVNALYRYYVKNVMLNVLKCL